MFGSRKKRLEVMAMSGSGRILIVDDEEDIRELLRAQLELSGYECTAAPDAQTATDLLEKEDFDIALLDVNMPGRSGLDVLPEIAARHPDLAVLMLTANHDVPMAVEAFKHGAYDYCTKPFVFDSLMRRLEQAQEKRALMLENREYEEMLEELVDDLEALAAEHGLLGDEESALDRLSALARRTRGRLARLLG